jgi:hypothetical protein
VLRLDQARVDGQLCLRSAEIGGAGTEAISASGIAVDGGADCDGLTAHGSVELGNATITGSCTLADARIQCPGQRALTMDRASIGRLGCRGLLVAGELRMHNAQIGATMIFAAAKLHNPGAVALSAGGISVAGGLFLTWGFEAVGEVRLYGATLAANLTMEGGTLRNPGGIALNLNRAAIGAFAGAELTCEGQISLAGSRVASDIDLRNSRLTGHGTSPAVLADRASVTADLLGDGMTCDGGIRVADATIGGELSFRGARVRNPGGIAVDAAALEAGELSLRLAEPADGLVELRHAQVRILRDDPASWPALLSIDGLSYEALEPRLPARQRLEWLGRDPAGPQPRPYEQLAAHYTAIGQPGEARQVMYASERIQHRAKTPLARAWSLLQDITIGYGYQPWRAAAWIAILLAAGSIVFAIAPPPPLGSGAAPHFNPVVYALDLLLPVVDLGQKHAFNPAGAEQWLSYLLIAAGWVLVTTVAAGAARVLSRR